MEAFPHENLPRAGNFASLRCLKGAPELVEWFPSAVIAVTLTTSPTLGSTRFSN